MTKATHPYATSYKLQDQNPEYHLEWPKIFKRQPRTQRNFYRSANWNRRSEYSILEVENFNWNAGFTDLEGCIY